MKRTGKILTAILLSSAFAAAPALAANMDGVARGPAKTDQGNVTTIPNTGTGAGAATDSGNTVVRGTNKSSNAEGSNGSVTTTGSVAAPASLETAQVSSVHVVNVKDLATSDTKTASSVATNTTPEEQQQIQHALASNPDVMSKLKAQSVDLSKVVAANYDGNGTVTVYVQ